MNLEEFEHQFYREKRLVKYLNYGTCLLIIALSALVLYSVIIEYWRIYSLYDKAFLISIFTYLLALGVYGIWVLRKKFTLTYWRNHLTKEENQALLQSTFSQLVKKDIQPDNVGPYFLYRKKWWIIPHKLYVFADHHLIAINVDTLSGGFIDFGASKRTRDKILSLMKQKASRKEDS